MSGPWEQYQEGPWTRYSQPEQPPAPRDENVGLLRRAADVPVGIAQGATMGFRMLAEAFGANNPVASAIRQTEDYLGELLSAQAQGNQQRMAEVFEEAKGKGVLDQLKIGLKAASEAPVELITQALGTAAPTVLTALVSGPLVKSALLARGASALQAARAGAAGQVAGQTATGLGMGVGISKSTIYDAVFEELSKTMPEDQARAAADEAQSYGGPNTDMIALGGILGVIGARYGIEPAVLGAIRGKAATGLTGVAAKGLATGAAESVTEFPQGFQEQVAENLALQRIGVDVPTFDKAFAAGTMEGVGGFGAGVGAGAISGSRAPGQEPPPETIPPDVETLPPDVESIPPEIPPVSTEVELIPPETVEADPQGRFSAEDIAATGVDIPAGNLPFVRRQVLGKTRSELEQFAQENPEVLEGEAPSARVIRALLEPAREPDQLGVEPPVPLAGPAVQPDAAGVVAPVGSGVADTGVDIGAPAVPAPSATPAVTPVTTETPSGITTPQAIEAEAQRPQEPIDTAEPIEEVTLPATASEAWNQMDRPTRLRVAEQAGISKPENLTNKNWGALAKGNRGKLEGAIASQQALPEPITDAGPVPSIEEAEAMAGIDQLERDRRRVERGDRSLLGNLRRIGLRESDLREVYGRNIPLAARNLIGKEGTGTDLSTLVANGTMDPWLPFDKRLGLARYDEQEGVEIIKDRLRNQDYLTEEAKLAIRGIDASIDDLSQDLRLEDINAELEIAAQEQRERDQEAEADTARAEDRDLERDQEAQAPPAAPDLELTPPTPEAQAESERRAAEAEEQAAQEAKATEEAEAKAKKERERKEIEDRSKGAAEDFQLGQTAEENLTGQKDIFAEPAEVQISPEEEKEQALKLFSARISLPTLRFKAKHANRTSFVSPKPLTDKQKDLLEELAGEAIDLGLPASALNLVTDAGSTGLGGVAAMTNSGSFLLSKQWASSTKAEKLFTFIHELSHAIDFQIGPRLSGKKFSEDAKWSTAHDELKSWYDNEPFLNPLIYPFAPQFAGKVRIKMESFAQAVSLYFTAPIRLQNKAPKTYSQIQSIIEGIQNESQATRAAGTTKAGPSGVQIQPARTAKDTAVQPAAGEVSAGVGTAERGRDRAAEQLGDTIEVGGKKRPTTNSSGRPIETSRERLQNFWRFFGDSKVVNENGEPLVVYHGSPVRDFNIFDVSKINANDPDGPFNGFFFSSSEKDADSAGRYPWARPNADDAQTRAFYLSIKNPATRKQAKEVAREIEDALYDSDQFQEKYPGARSLQDATRQELQKRGYDGIIFEPYVTPSREAFERDGRVKLGKNASELVLNEDGYVELYERGELITDYGDFDEAMDKLRHGVFIAFRPEQIKLAIGNRGTYSEEAAAIDMMQKGDLRFTKAPDWVPQNIWTLHEKVLLADLEASGEVAAEGADGRGKSPGVLKRNQTMAFRRLNKAVEDYVGDDWSKVNDLMVRMNQESRRREEGVDSVEINMIQTPIADPDSVKGDGKKAIESSQRSILYRPVDATWENTNDTTEFGLSDNFFYNWIDKLVDLRRVQDIIKATGKRINVNFDARERAKGYDGRVRYRIEKYMEEELKPMVDLMIKNGISQKEFGEFLLNRHAPEANAEIARRNPTKPDGGSSIKTADALAYMANLNPNRKRQLEQVAAKLRETHNRMQQMLVDSGLEKAETIVAWNEMFPNYIPLEREDGDFSVAKAMSQGAGYSQTASVTKSRTGSDRPVNIEQLFSNIAAQHERMILKAERVRIGQSILGLALENPNPKFWLVIDPETDVVWKTIRDTEEMRAERDSIKEQLEDPAISQSRKADLELELDLVNRMILKRSQPARSAMAKARDDLMNLGYDDKQAMELVKNLMMPPTTARYNKKTGKVVFENNIGPSGEFLFGTRVNGADKYVLFNGNDPRAARMSRALKNMDAQNLNYPMQMAAHITRFFANINTQYNPVFGIYNFGRDLQTASLQISTTDIADQRAEVIKGASQALVDLTKHYRGKRKGVAPKTKAEESIDTFLRYGGQTGFRDMYSQKEERARAIQRMIDPSSWAESPMGKVFSANGKLKVPMEQARKAIAPMFEMLSDYNQVLENATRLSAFRVAYQKYIDQGLSADDAGQKAAAIAKDITVDFNQKGIQATQAGALYAFFNASVQGTYMMAKTYAGPLGKKIIQGSILLGAVQAVMMALAGFEDDQPPEFVKQRNYIIPYGDGKYVAIPMPLGFNVLPTVSRLVTEWFLSGGKNTSDKVIDILDAIMDMYNPIGNAGMSFQTLAPTLLDPLVAIAENKDWTGKDIARKDFNALNPTPGYTRSRDSANNMSVEVARFLNNISGGTDHTKGKFSPTADQLEYLVGQLTGGVGREAMKLGKTIEAQFTGEEIPTYTIPLFGRFVGNTNEAASVSSAFYRNLMEVNRHKAEVTGRQKAGENAQEYILKNPESRLMQAADSQYRTVQNLRKLRRELLQKGEKERAKVLEERITEIMRRFNERYKEVAG